MHATQVKHLEALSAERTKTVEKLSREEAVLKADRQSTRAAAKAINDKRARVSPVAQGAGKGEVTADHAHGCVLSLDCHRPNSAPFPSVYLISTICGHRLDSSPFASFPLIFNSHATHARALKPIDGGEVRDGDEDQQKVVGRDRQVPQPRFQGRNRAAHFTPQQAHSPQLRQNGVKELHISAECLLSSDEEGAQERRAKVNPCDCPCLYARKPTFHL